jgi:predicted nucleotidyltransferase
MLWRHESQWIRFDKGRWSAGVDGGDSVQWYVFLWQADDPIAGAGDGSGDQDSAREMSEGMLQSFTDSPLDGYMMLPPIEEHRPQIEALCRQYCVVRLELFGSAARGDFDPEHSDLDFFVDFEDLGWKGSFRRYMGLKIDLEELLGRPVDLVEPKAIANPYFALVANRYRTLVYAA